MADRFSAWTRTTTSAHGSLFRIDRGGSHCSAEVHDLRPDAHGRIAWQVGCYDSRMMRYTVCGSDLALDARSAKLAASKALRRLVASKG